MATTEQYQEITRKLENLRTLYQSIRMDEERLNAMVERMLSLSGGALDGMPHGNAYDKDKIGIAVCNKQELERAMQAEREAYYTERTELENLVMQLQKPVERQILLLRYFDVYEWTYSVDRETGVKMNGILEIMYGRNENFYFAKDVYQRKMYRIHNSAKEHLAELYARK